MFLAESNDLGSLLIWIIFILLPLLGRLFGWFAKKFGAAGAQTKPRPNRAGVEPSTPMRVQDLFDIRSDADRRAEVAEASGVGGGDLPESVSVTPVHKAPKVHKVERAATRASVSDTSLVDASSFAPFADFEESTSIGTLRDYHLESSAFRRTTEVGEDAYALKTKQASSMPTDRNSLRRAILWCEILGPPVSLRADEPFRG